MKKVISILTILLLFFSACSSRQNSINLGKTAGATVGAAGGALVGGMMGLLIAGGGTNKNTSAIVAGGAVIGALTGAMQGYNVGKIISGK